MSPHIGIVGVSGYAGVELLRLLAAHDGVTLSTLAAGRAAGDRLGATWPGLPPGLAERPVVAPDPAVLARTCDAVVLALPHGISGTLVPALLDAGVRHVIDLGADFRLRNPSVYARAYGHPHPCPALLEEAVYGLPELARDELPGARLVAAPGCYPTATALAARPLLDLVEVDWLVADCISGISGAGRRPGPRNLYCEVQESVTAYGLGGTHRHTPELEQLLGCQVSFTPHLAPMRRGMLATVTARPLGGVPSAATLDAHFRAFYAGHPMVHVRDRPPSTADVRGTACGQVYVAVDPARGVITAVAVIDNLGKGAAGQAVHDLNLVLGLPETQGLPTVPVLP